MPKPLSIGIIVHLGENLLERLTQIRELGLSHVQLGYGEGWDTPGGHAAILKAVADNQLEITTVFCGYEGESYADIPTVHETVGLVPPATRAVRLERTTQISRFAQALGVSRVALHIGFIPEDPAHELYAGLVTDTQNLADELAARGQTLAFETGQETARTLHRFLTDVGRANLRVNFDPANMILYGNDNPLEATPVLAKWIDEVHCKDGNWPTEAGQLGQETPFGQGSINVPAWIAGLLALGFRGPLTIEREISGPQQIEDVRAAKVLLESLLPSA